MEWPIRLSVEELAFLLTQVGHPEMGRSVIVAQLGREPDQPEVRARALAAAHGLMARGWIKFGSDEDLQLAAPLTRVARVLSQADLSISYTLSTREADFTQAYHYGEGGVFEHAIEQGIINRIAEVANTDMVIAGGVGFFELADSHPCTGPAVTIPKVVLDEINDEPDLHAIALRLKEHGVSQETRMLLAEDILNPQARGSVMRVEYGQDAIPWSDHGLLVLRGLARSWLLRPSFSKDGDFVTIMPGTEQTFRREVIALL